MKSRKIIILCFLICCLSSPLGAQNRWPWSKGPLEWWMFRLRDTTEAFPTNLKIRWEKVPDEVSQVRTVILVNTIEAYLDLDSAWVRADNLTEDILERNQQCFDRAHILAENNWKYAFMNHLPVETVLDSCRLQYEAGLGLTEAGYDFRQVEWKTEGRQFFSALSYICLVPAGSLGQITGPTQGLSLEAGLLSGKRALSAEVAVGGGDYRNRSLGMTGASASGTGVPFFGAFLKSSRTLVQTRDLRLSLFGGAGYSRRGLVKDQKPIGLGGPSLSEGLAGEWRCFTRIQARRSPFRQSEYVLRLRLYSDQIWYQTPRFFSPTFNFSIGIGSKYGSVRPMYHAYEP